MTNGVDDYIAGFPKEVQVILEQMRATIKEAGAELEETIAYRSAGVQDEGVCGVFCGI